MQLEKINMLNKAKLDSLDTTDKPNQLFATLDENSGDTLAFAEAERQKGKNLWAHGDVSGTRWKDTVLTTKLPIGTYTFSAEVTNSDTSSNYALVEFYDSSGKWMAGKEISKIGRGSFTITLPRECYKISCIGTPTATTGVTFTFANIMITTDGSTDYRPYTGAILRETDLAPVKADVRNLINAKKYQHNIVMYTNVQASYNNRILFNYVSSRSTALTDFSDLFRDIINNGHTTMETSIIASGCYRGTSETNTFKYILGVYCDTYGSMSMPYVNGTTSGITSINSINNYLGFTDTVIPL